MTFEGECRADEDVKAHLHESPPTMVIPLVVLAVLSAIGGLTGWPHFIAHGLHLPEGFLFFEHWFDEVFYHSQTYRIVGRFGAHPYGMEGLVTGLGTAAGLSGIGLAFYIYMKKPEIAENIKERLEGLHTVLTNKYYVDEGYDAIFVKGSIKSGDGMTFFDKHILDGVFVNGVGAAMRTAGRILRHLQSGNVQRYATYIALGVVLALIALLVMYSG